MKKFTFYISLVFSILSFTHLQANPDTLIENISTAQGHETILAYAGNPNFVILDVRTPGEYATHIEGAVNIDYNNPNFSSVIDSLNRNKIYLIHCAGGTRSAKARDTMQTKHFKTVYNMLGGISGWITAAYPTTTIVAPEIGILTDSIIVFNNVPSGNLDSTLVTITNSKNSVLQFTSSTNLSTTEFCSQFQISHSLAGARDYSFYIHYQPTDLMNDSIEYSIISNGGTKHIYLLGKYNKTGINISSLNNFKIIANKSNNSIEIYSDVAFKNETIQIFDFFGRLLLSRTISGNNATISFKEDHSGLIIIKTNTVIKKIFW